MATQTGSYDFKAAKAAHDEAAKVAGNYIVSTAANDVWIHSEDHGPDSGGNATSNTYGWRIGSVFELVRQGVSWFKLWVENNAAKIRLGRSDQSHLILDSDSLDIEDSSSDIVAHFGVDGSRIYGPDAVPLFDIDTDGSVKTVDVVIGAPQWESDTFHEDVTLSKTVAIPEFSSGTSFVLTQSSIGSFPFNYSGIMRFSGGSNYTTNTSSASISGDGVTLSFSSSNTIQASAITFSVGTPETAYGTIEGIIRSGTFHPTATIDYRFDVAYDGGSELTFTHTISIEWSSTPSSSDYQEYQAGYMRTAGTVELRSPSYSLGTRFGESGDYSVIIGEGLIAQSDNQIALGMYNVADLNGTYAAIIGNGTADNARSNAATIAWDGNYIAQAMAGIIQMFAGSTPPTGWLVCDGSAVSRTTYAVLFAAIGTTWGTGDGSTTFNLPDLRGRAPVGAGAGSGLTSRTLGTKAGAETHNHNNGKTGSTTLTAAQSGVPAHGHGHTIKATTPKFTHSVTQPTVTMGMIKTAASGTAKWHGSSWADRTGSYTANVTGSSVGDHAATACTMSGSVSNNTAANATSGHDHSISAGDSMQPFAVVNFIICTGKAS